MTETEVSHLKPTILHAFPDIKQYGRFQEVPSKFNYNSKKFFHSSYHTIVTLSESF